VADAPIRYQSNDEDSARWNGFPFREGDIVISTRSKSGTTWMQMICALLIFQTPELPQPLGTLSPWLDWKIEPLDDVVARLQAQPHRRFVKTHTPLDGVVLDDRATYIVVARDPRDMYISLYHQGANIDRGAVRRMLGQPEPTEPVAGTPSRPLDEALQRWIDDDSSPQERMDGIRGVFHHATDAWTRQQERPNVILVHYSDLLADLEGEMRTLAARLGVDVPSARWPVLVDAATFTAMRDRATTLVPDGGGVLKDVNAFFRKGTAGSWRELMTDDQLTHYEQRVAELAPPDVVAWLHHGAGAAGLR
jgi:aryl sulfotransferase